MDFRVQAAEATLSRLRDTGKVSPVELDESGCVPVPGGRGIHCVVELSSVFVSTVCLIIAVSALPLTLLGVLSLRWMYPILLIGLAVALVFRKVKSWLMRMYLRLRSDSLLKPFGHLPSMPVGLEDARTHKKAKLVIEDEGVCLLDSERHRLLFEGCSYRYVIYAGDVLSVEPVSGYALSGARVNCMMAGHSFDAALMSAGQGAVASLIQAFSPSTEAKSLASHLNRTLFGSDSATYRPNVVPPRLSTGD